MPVSRPLWLVLGILVMCTPRPARGQWTVDPGPAGLLVYPQSLNDHEAVPDGTGGMVIGIAQWFGSNNVHAVILQRVDGHGNLPWGSSGVGVGNVGLLVNPIYIPKLSPDGAGGVFALFYDVRQSYDLVAKHIGSNGSSIWPPDRVALAPGGESDSRWISTDGTGGCIAVWKQYSSPYPHYAQRLDATGGLLWGANGIALGFDTVSQAAFAPDGAGGFFATWSQDGPVDNDIYAQHYGPNGAPLWPTGGIPVCAAAGDQGSGTPGIAAIADGAGGVCIAWIDRRADSGGDLYAQRLDGIGDAQWTPDGVALCTTAGAQHHPVAVADGSGGMVVVWQDERSGSSNIDLFAQKVDGGGNVRWPADGAIVCDAPGNQVDQAVSSDGGVGTYVAWQDARDPSSANDIYVEHINAFGITRSPCGVMAGSTAFDLCCPSVVANTGGPTVSWNAPSFEVRARQVAAAIVGVESRPTSLTFLEVAPNPSSGATYVSFSLTEPGTARLEALDVTGRRVWTRVEKGLGTGRHVRSIPKLPVGVYLVRLLQGSRIASAKAVFVR